MSMLLWHRRLWLIDHGAALYFQHAWTRRDQPAKTPFGLIKDHVLLGLAGRLEEVDAELKARLEPAEVAALVDLIPDAWLGDDPGFESKSDLREAYLRFFTQRLASSRIFVQEAVHARSSHV